MKFAKLFESKEGKNGGAVHLINYEIHCNDSNFIDCVSLSGAGGGIYIKIKIGSIFILIKRK